MITLALVWMRVKFEIEPQFLYLGTVLIDLMILFILDAHISNWFRVMA